MKVLKLGSIKRKGTRKPSIIVTSVFVIDHKLYAKKRVFSLIEMDKFNISGLFLLVYHTSKREKNITVCSCTCNPVLNGTCTTNYLHPTAHFTLKNWSLWDKQYHDARTLKPNQTAPVKDAKKHHTIFFCFTIIFFFDRRTENSTAGRQPLNLSERNVS